MSARFEPIIGRYATLTIGGRENRVYIEEAGQGIPLLCLHTAGADARQYRGVMNDPTILERYRVIAFDLPYHGKSAPPAGFHREPYMLSTERYIETVMAVVDALELERPAVMGCSIGGRVVLHLALRHGARFRAAIGLQSGQFAESAWSEAFAATDFWNRPDVHGGEACAGIVASLIGPEAPTKERWESLWYYMQGGPGVFAGDLHYYFDDGDLRNSQIAGIDTKVCPLYLLSGEYDWSAPPAAAEEIARAVKGAKFELMKGLGHFPMSEDPQRFLSYLRPVLGEIADAA